MTLFGVNLTPAVDIIENAGEGNSNMGSSTAYVISCVHRREEFWAGAEIFLERMFPRSSNKYVALEIRWIFLMRYFVVVYNSPTDGDLANQIYADGLKYWNLSMLGVFPSSISFAMRRKAAWLNRGSEFADLEQSLPGIWRNIFREFQIEGPA